MTKNNYAILLAGGQGTRFWPKSRTLEPKQFLSFHEETCLFAQTVERIMPLIPPENIFIATSELYRNQVLELCRPYGITEKNMFFEPEGKNTAPSIGVSCRLISMRDPSARIAVLPCDHLIKKTAIFLKLLSRAIELSETGLVIFGIEPSRPATGYGYIKVQTAKSQQLNRPRDVFNVERFCEKPDLSTAKKFLKDGRYFWNSGMFVGSAEIFMNEFKRNLPEMHAVLRRINTLDVGKLWKKIQSVSFDYGVMEKARNVCMLSAGKIGWSDLGSWQAWDETCDKDADGNNFKGDVISIDSIGTTVLGTGRVIATIGLKDVIVVDTPDALLVTRKESSEDVKKVVDSLKSSNRQEHYLHKTVKRPWGSYTVLDTGVGFKVKVVEVKPKKALSLQLHNRRSEHWVVVEGVAKIVRDKNTYIVNANESTFIPMGCVHRIVNPGETMLKIVEVQSGDYLEEDDIIRLKDDFGRA